MANSSPKKGASIINTTSVTAYRGSPGLLDYSDTPLGRAGEPWECAGCFVFLASDESSYMTGQTLHPNGGEIING